MRLLLDAIHATGRTQGPRLVALYGCMYYGMLRPSEATSLQLDECTLPESGWGLLEFSEVRSAAGREWTDDGEVHELRKPKGGPRNAIRRVPIPPMLVTMIRSAGLGAGETGRPRQDSNLRTRLRRPLLYPLSYGGPGREKDYQYPAPPKTAVGTPWLRLGHVVAGTSRDTLASRRGAGSGTRTSSGRR
jgi:hypothetical protein